MSFWYFKFFQKTNENKLTWGIIVVKSIFICSFFGRIEDKELGIPKSPLARTHSISRLKSRVLKSTFLTRQLFTIVFKSKILVKCTVLKQNAPLCFDALISLDRRSVGATYQLTLKLRYEFAPQWSQALRNMHGQGDLSPSFFW